MASAHWEYFPHLAGLDFQAFTSKFYIGWRLNGSPADLAIFTTFIFHFHRMLCHGAVAIRQLCESIQLCKVSNWNYVSGGGELRTLTVVHSAPEYFHCKINFIRRHRGPAPSTTSLPSWNKPCLRTINFDAKCDEDRDDQILFSSSLHNKMWNFVLKMLNSTYEPLKFSTPRACIINIQKLSISLHRKWALAAPMNSDNR